MYHCLMMPDKVYYYYSVSDLSLKYSAFTPAVVWSPTLIMEYVNGYEPKVFTKDDFVVS